MTDPTVISIALVMVMVFAYLLWRLPQECRCDECPDHSKERRDKSETRRAKVHRALHSNHGVPWGDKICAQCRLGHERDRES